MGQDRKTEQTGSGGYHEPVLVEEVAGLLDRVGPGPVVDATFGGGGHTRRLMQTLGGEVELVAIDRDPAAAVNAAALGVRFLAGDFGDLDALLDGAGVGSIAGILFDLGISSHHVDEPSRGFSYRQDGPLDMRMDPATSTTAADLVNTLPADELARLIARYGEEPYARAIAAAIVARRPFSRTLELAEAVAGAVPARARREAHPARRTFQALRIAVNDELGSLQRGLEAGVGRLQPGGRVVVISYHSLEDRIVKRRLAAGASGCVCPPDLPVCGCGALPELRLLTRGAVRPTPEEVRRNPRARSARLRAAEKARAA